MKKAIKIIQIGLICLAPIFLMFIFLPTHIVSGNETAGYKVIFTNPITAIGFLSPILACLLLIFRNKIKDVQMLSIVFYLLGGILILTSAEKIGSLAFCSVFAVILCFISTILLFFILNNLNSYSTYDIVEGAMLISLAIALDLPGLKIQLGSGGGSISFTTIPLFILALRQGPLKGFIGCGIIYGIITCLIDGWGLQTYPFDYLLAYGSICTIGFFKNLIINTDAKYTVKSMVALVIGVVIAVFLRFVFACMSSMILYEYTLGASLAYNAVYVLPSGGVALALLLILYKPLSRLSNHIDMRNHVQSR